MKITITSVDCLKIFSESLWDFLINLGISSLEKHPYFGNVEYLITEVKTGGKLGENRGKTLDSTWNQDSFP